MVKEGLARTVKLMVESDRPEEVLNRIDEIVQKSWSTQNRVEDLWLGLMLLIKGSLLHKTRRLEEALSVFNEVETRLGSIPNCDSLVDEILFTKAYLLSQMERFDEAVEVFDKATERIAPRGRRQLLGQALVDKGIVLGISGRIEDAIEVYDEVTSQLGSLNSDGIDKLVARALVNKGTLLAQERNTLSEEEVAGLLGRLIELDELPINTIAVLIQFSAKVGPARALELIQASPGKDLLLPLVTALQQELGEAPKVSCEVEEVAKDIRRELHEIR